MNTATHLLAGMLIARLFRKEGSSGHYGPGEFPVLFTGVSALLPDLDAAFGIPHAQATHTSIVTLLLATAWTLVVVAAGRPFLVASRTGVKRLFLLSLVGAGSHLVLDIFTYYNGDCSATAAHVYFWPLWNQSFHLDCIFGPSQDVYLTRVLIEWAFFSPFLLAVWLYRGARYRENPFMAFSPRAWLVTGGLDLFHVQPFSVKASVVMLLVVSMAVIVAEGLGYIT